MTFTAVGSVLTSSTTTISINPGAVGHFFLLETITNSASYFATSISGGNCTWTTISTHNNATNAHSTSMFIGVATATGSATATITFSGTPGTEETIGQEFSSTTGFLVDAFGFIDNVGTNNLPSLTPAGAGELYWCYTFTGGTAGAGTTPGYTWGTALTNEWCYNTNCNSATQAPIVGGNAVGAGGAVLIRSGVLQSASTSSAGVTVGSVTATLPNNAIAGTKLIAVVTASSASGLITSVQDAALNSLTQIAFVQGSATGGSTSAIYAMDTPAGDVGIKPAIKFTYSITGDLGIWVAEVSGLLSGNTTAMVDGTAAVVQETPTASQAQPAYTSHAAGEFLVSVMTDNGNNVTWALSGYIIDANSINTNGFNDIVVGYKGSSNGAESGTWTTGNTPTGSGLMVVAFQFPPVSTAWTHAQFPSTFYIGRRSGIKRRWRPRQTAITVSSAANVQYTETLIAVIAATDVNNNRVGKLNVTPVAVTGTQQRSVSKTVVAVTALSGNVIRSVLHALITVLAVAAGITRRTQRALTGGVAALPVVAAVRTRIAVLIASLAVTVSTQRTIGRVLAVPVAILGAATRNITRIVTAPLAAAAVNARSTARNLTATVVVTGVTGIQKFKQIILTAAVALGPVITRNISRGFQVPVVILGNVTRNIAKTYITVTAISSAASRRVSRNLIAVTALLGNMRNQTGKLLQNPVAITGNQARKLSKIFTAPAAVSATIVRNIARAVTAVFAVIPVVTRQVRSSLTGTIAVAVSFTASATHGVIQVTLTAVTALTSTIPKNINRVLQTPVAVTGTVTRMINRIFITPVALSSVFAQIKAKFLTLTASIAVIPVTVKRTGKTVIIPIAVTGSLTSRISKNIIAGIAVVPSVTRRVGKTVSGVIAVLAAQSQIKLRNVILSAATVVTGNIQRKLMPNLAVSLTIVSGSIRSIARTIQGTLGIAGQTARGIGRVFTTATAIISGITQTKFKSVILAASIAVTTVVQKKIFTTVPATVTVTMRIIRGLFTRFKANVAASPVFSTGKTYFFTFATSVSAVTSLTIQSFTNLQDLVFKQGVAGFQWIVGSVTKRWRA